MCRDGPKNSGRQSMKLPLDSGIQRGASATIEGNLYHCLPSFGHSAYKQRVPSAVQRVKSLQDPANDFAMCTLLKVFPRHLSLVY